MTGPVIAVVIPGVQLWLQAIAHDIGNGPTRPIHPGWDIRT